MSCLLLASAADNVALWECQSYNIVKQYDPFKRNVSSIAWSHDNTRLVSTCDKSPDIAVTSVNGSNIITTDFTTNLPSSVGMKCVNFNSRSRYIISGGTDHVLYVHDLKSRSLRRAYRVHASPITSVTFNFNDTYVASGDDGGRIIVHNVSTGQSSSPLVAPHVQAIKRIRYNPFRKSVLGAVSDDGSLNLWDCNTRRLLHSFRDGHQAPAMDLVMSPVNETFIVTVGLDKRVAFYDSTSKRTLPPLLTDTPLTAVDMLNDGYTLALGTSRGQIHIHDLRMGHKQQLASLTLHHSSIHALRFQKPPSRVSSGSTTLKSYSQTTATTVGDNTPQRNGTTAITSGVGVPPQNQPEAVELFSPLKDVPPHDTQHVPMSPHHPRDASAQPSFYLDTGVISPLGSDQHSSMSLSESASASFILPLANEKPQKQRSPLVTDCVVVQTSKGSALTRIASKSPDTPRDQPQPIGSVEDSVIPPKLSGYTPPRPADTSDPADAVRLGDCGGVANVPMRGTGAVTPTTTARINSTRGTPATDPDGHPAVPTPTPRDAVLPTPTSTVPRSEPRTHERAVDLSGRDDQPVTGPRIHHDCLTSETNDGSAVTSMTAAPATAVMLQQDLLRSMIEESMDELREDNHNDYLNLYATMIGLFHSQMQQIEARLQYYSVNEELVAENERLRAENERLKCTF